MIYLARDMLEHTKKAWLILLMYIAFCSRVKNCKNIWEAREKVYLQPGQDSFFEYVMRYYAEVISTTMLRGTRISVGLGLPPTIFTTNSSESLNAALKRKVDHKETEWPQFNDTVKQYISGQRDEVLRAISGRGEYKISQEYDSLLVSPQEWTKMTPDQRKCAVKKFDSAKLKHIEVAETGASTSGSAVSARKKSLGISVEKCGISTLPLSVLEAMWNKAENYLQSDVAVATAPGGDPKAKMVVSCSGSTPHFVQVKPHGQYLCDKQCLQWSSSQICSHTLVAAEVNGELHLFLKWYVRTKQAANITKLAQAGLPSGRGRKGGVPKRQRSRTPIASPEVVVHRPALSQPAAKRRISSLPSNPTVSQHNVPTLCSTSQSLLLQGQHVFIQSQSVPSASANPSAFTSGPGSIQSSNPFLCNISSSVSASEQNGPSVDSQPLLLQGQQVYIQSPILPTSTPPVSAGSSTTISAPNINPFYIKFIEGNIRVCQGCRGNLRHSSGSIPAPPYDLCVARAERRSYRDANGVLRTPRKEQAAHYHINLCCIQAVCPNFAPSTLSIPPDLVPKLGTVHKEYLRLIFGLSL